MESAIDEASIYIGQVDYSTTPQELSEFFSSAGKVSLVTIPGHPWTGLPQGYAYLKFEALEAQLKAIETLDGAEFRGRNIKVD
mmetsp:Transcript_42847/g.96916  ORF Transcript_42847/g.96916 Transcript_42847/m.96916 type:complete len:83 (+) Transcript_42847:119-367(+)|eukprot:CAMPEP_0181265136 /NCGR_PEP_ID=MMETSP1097-20121128/3546_1 /TAXON_ID=35684 /ORGANISM="Pseudopedinella elastica, Strain CCMP716" /LENGTH=82 /DNA_ID=CAMNT_0023364157 /DNA_START=12 /DNA_END=260 /DNA_ORIENTATION=+